MRDRLHFISDLHLTQQNPHLLSLFERYIDTHCQCDALYLLGDIFEVWLGDDDNSRLNEQVGEMLQALSAAGTRVYFMAGNRDFLLGDAYASRYRITRISEPHILQLNHAKIALLHGDHLCTDDEQYQTFRDMVRSERWQKEFLSMPLDQRKAIARDLREKSKAAQMQKTDEIMDVNQDAVVDFFKQTSVDGLIHGHTHRPHRHELKLPDNKTVWRHVLADWRDQGHYLSYSEGQFTDHYFSI